MLRASERLRASARAALATVLDPPSLKVSLKIGDAEILTRTTGICITDNLFGEGHLPYADRPDGGVLGIYVTVARQRSQILRYFLDVARGRWRDSPQVEIHEGEKVVLTLLSRGRQTAMRHRWRIAASRAPNHVRDSQEGAERTRSGPSRKPAG